MYYIYADIISNMPDELDMELLINTNTEEEFINIMMMDIKKDYSYEYILKELIENYSELKDINLDSVKRTNFKTSDKTKIDNGMIIINELKNNIIPDVKLAFMTKDPIIIKRLYFGILYRYIHLVKKIESMKYL